MRPRLLFPLLLLMGALCPGVGLLAQQQESRIERIVNPNLNQSFDLDRSRTFGSKSFSTKSGSPATKGFWLPQKVGLKDYLTGDFKGGKSFWMGDFKYSATTANTTPRSLLVIPKNSDAGKSAAVKSDREAEKQFATRAVSTRDYRGGGAFTSARDNEKLKALLTPEQAATNGYQGDMHELKSIDDVRALLNKSK